MRGGGKKRDREKDWVGCQHHQSTHLSTMRPKLPKGTGKNQGVSTDIKEMAGNRVGPSNGVCLFSFYIEDFIVHAKRKQRRFHGSFDCIDCRGIHRCTHENERAWKRSLRERGGGEKGEKGKGRKNTHHPGAMNLT